VSEVFFIISETVIVIQRYRCLLFAETVWKSTSDESNKESIGIHDFGRHSDENLQVRNSCNHIERVDDVSKLEHANDPLLSRIILQPSSLLSDDAGAVGHGATYP